MAVAWLSWQAMLQGPLLLSEDAVCAPPVARIQEFACYPSVR